MKSRMAMMKEKMASKASALKDSASKAVKHTANKARANQELHDMVTEAAALPKATLATGKWQGRAVNDTLHWMQLMAAVDAETEAKFGEEHKLVMDKLGLAQGKMEVFHAGIKEYLEAASAAKKAAKKDEPNAAQLKADAERIKKSNMPKAMLALAEVYNESNAVLLEAARQKLAVIRALPEANPDGHLAFEELWDEPRPVLGNGAQKPTTASENLWEELASFPRPVDGDTRVKYIKAWNRAIADVVTSLRKCYEKLDLLHKLRVKMTAFIQKWVDAADKEGATPNKEYGTYALYFTNANEQFANVHLPAALAAMEEPVKFLESHLLPIPQKGAGVAAVNKDILDRRQADGKKALLANLGAVEAFLAAGETDLVALVNNCGGEAAKKPFSAGDKAAEAIAMAQGLQGQAVAGALGAVAGTGMAGKMAVKMGGGKVEKQVAAKSDAAASKVQDKADKADQAAAGVEKLKVAAGEHK